MCNVSIKTSRDVETAINADEILAEKNIPVGVVMDKKSRKCNK